MVLGSLGPCGAQGPGPAPAMVAFGEGAKQWEESCHSVFLFFFFNDCVLIMLIVRTTMTEKYILKKVCPLYPPTS